MMRQSSGDEDMGRARWREEDLRYVAEERDCDTVFTGEVQTRKDGVMCIVRSLTQTYVTLLLGDSCGTEGEKAV